MCKVLVMICGETSLAARDGGYFILLGTAPAGWWETRPYHPITLTAGLCASISFYSTCTQMD